MYFITNVIFEREKFSAHLIYLSFSKFSYRQNMFVTLKQEYKPSLTVRYFQ